MEGVEPVETFIHELQHKLFGVHPLHPSQKINQDLNIDFNAGIDFLKFPKFIGRLDNSSLVKSLFDKTKESIDPHYEKKMTNLGLDEKNKQTFRNFIKQLNPQQVQYIAGGHDLNGTEIVSRLDTSTLKNYDTYVSNACFDSNSEDPICSCINLPNSSHPDDSRDTEFCMIKLFTPTFFFS
jgi:hypothetical protein